MIEFGIPSRRFVEPEPLNFTFGEVVEAGQQDMSKLGPSLWIEPQRLSSDLLDGHLSLSADCLSTILRRTSCQDATAG